MAADENINASDFNLPGNLEEFNVEFYFTGTEKSFPIDSSNVYEVVVRYRYDIEYVTGYIKFKDTICFTDLVTSSPLLNVVIKTKDCLKNNYEANYIITRIEKSISNSGSIIYMEFIDEFSFILLNTYMSIGYEKANTPDFIMTFYGEYIIKNLIHQKTMDLVGEYDDIENYIIPGNISLASFIKQRKLIEGFCIVNNRKGITIMKPENMWKNTINLGITMKQDLKNISPFTFKDIIIQESHLDTNLYTPTTVKMFLKDDEKGSNKINLKILDYENMQKIMAPDLGIPLYAISGLRYLPYKDSWGENIYYNQILDTYNILITPTSGSSIYCLGAKVKIEIPTVMKFEGYKVLNIGGEYVITFVEDQILGGVYHQKLGLKKPGNQKE